MLRRTFALLLVFAVAMLVSAPVLAADETHEGTVVKAADGKLTIEGAKDKKEHTCTVAKDAKITCDGKECKLDDLKKGVKVKVTLSDKKEATKIDATTK
jgi:predicted lipoprotein